MTGNFDGSETNLAPIAKRIPIRSEVDLSYPTFEGLVTAVSSNLSTSGMFIQTAKPEAVGTVFSFQFRIEEWSPIQGRAEVVWSRAESEGPERPAGMGIRFVELDAQSRRMIRYIVDKHLEGGGKPFDISTVPAGASKFAGRKSAAKKQRVAAPVDDLPPADDSTKMVSGRRMLLLAPIIVILVAAGIGAYLLWFDDQPTRFRIPGRGSTGAGTSAAVGDDPTSEESGSTDEESDAATEIVSTEVVMRFVENWAGAWESREPDRLIALYSDAFEASEYGGREAWETQVADRMRSSQFIRVAVSALEIEFPSADTAQASFYRSFRSDRSNETRRLILELEPETTGWKIRSERFLD